MATQYKRRRKRRQYKPRDENAPVKPAALQTIMERSFRLLAARGRGIEELRRRLLTRADATPEIVEQAIEKLIGYDYLNDEKFARDYSHSKVRVRPMGRRRLERDMLQKHLPEDLVRNTLDEVYELFPETALVKGFVENHERHYGLPKTYKDVKKLSDKLMRRGFAPGVVREHTGALWSKAKEAGVPSKKTDDRDEAQIEADMDALIAKFIRIKGTPKNFKDAKKLSDRLMRRGYNYDAIRAKVDPLWKS